MGYDGLHQREVLLPMIWTMPISGKCYLCTPQKKGRLAQLVQSTCLTSRGSLVRIHHRPPFTSHMPCAFYILYSSSLDRYYIGHTCQSIEERLAKHNSDHRGYTSHVKHWTAVYIERYTDKSAAYAREREVKGWKNRQMLVKLINQSRK